MSRTGTLTKVCVALAAASVLLACKKPPKPITTVVVQKVDANLSKPDPDAEYWEDVDEGFITMLAQPMIAPRPESTTTEKVYLKAAHDGKHAAFRLRWQDSEQSEAGRLGEFSDAFALEFPLKDGALPPVMMGAKDQPVHLFHWRAQYQRDHLKGKPTIKDLYPNASIDMYPHEYKEAKVGSPEAREKYAPAQAEGNPQSYLKRSIDEIVAEGFSTSSVQEGGNSDALGSWKNGEWTLVIVRPLLSEGNKLRAGAESNVAFAAWQGGKGEVGSRKSVTMQWTPVRVQ